MKKADLEESGGVKGVVKEEELELPGGGFQGPSGEVVSVGDSRIIDEEGKAVSVHDSEVPFVGGCC